MSTQRPLSLLILLLLSSTFAHGSSGLSAEEHYLQSKNNKIYAQQLVNDVVKKHPDLLVVALHSKQSYEPVSRMIASNIDRIGKKDDADDQVVATERKIIIAPNTAGLNKIEVLLPLLDSNEICIGTLGLVFKFEKGGNSVDVLKKALLLQKQLSSKIANSAALGRSVTLEAVD
ncbi:MAG TPA: hypothetical protein V6C89_15135 [Drouetiella sp.]